MSLPESFALQPKDSCKYLRYVTDDSQKPYGVLDFSGDELWTPYTIFKVEKAKTVDGFFNIRSVYNNKYWVIQSTNNDGEYVFVAKADEPNEVQSDASCTLFHPSLVIDDDPNVITILHVNLNKYVYLPKASSLLTISLGPKHSHQEQPYEFVVTNVGKRMLLPKHVTFIGDNGHYLSVVGRSTLLLKFSERTPNDRNAQFATSKVEEHGYHIRSVPLDTLWRRDPDSSFIHADLTPNSDSKDPTAIFQPFWVGPNLVVLHVDNNKYYCVRRNTDENGKDYLTSLRTEIYSSKIPKNAILEVIESIEYRSINNLKFKDDQEKRLYDKRVCEEASKTVVNESDTENLPVEFDLCYLHHVTRTWDSSVSRKIFNQVNFVAPETPYKITLDGGKEINVDFPLQDYVWGERFRTRTEESFHYTAIVPPKTRVKVSVIATKGLIDVPFTYTQHDTLLDDQQVTLDFEDGIFTSTVYWDVTCDTKMEPIEA